MSVKYYSYMMACCVYAFISAAPGQSASEDGTTEAVTTVKVEKLSYDDYVKRANERIAGLRESIALAENVHGQVQAYALFLHAKTQEYNSSYFYFNGDALDDEKKLQIDKLEWKMRVLNIKAFIASKKACQRVVEAEGFGDQFLFTYYREKLDELKNAIPIR